MKCSARHIPPLYVVFQLEHSIGSGLGWSVHCASARLAPTAIEPPNSSDAAVKDRNANRFSIDHPLRTGRRFSRVATVVV